MLSLYQLHLLRMPYMFTIGNKGNIKENWMCVTRRFSETVSVTLDEVWRKVSIVA